MARQCFQQVRQLTDQLYPMLVAEVGLPLALRCVVASFAERTRTRIACHTSECPRLLEEIEIGLFRLVEDCLQHLHEPERGTSALSLTIDGGAVRLAIRSVLPEVAAHWRKRFALQFGDAVNVQSAFLLPDERLPQHIEAQPGVVVTVPAVVVGR
jgi:glucose-6-phosphate-specific signal transduction histidine kinase